MDIDLRLARLERDSRRWRSAAVLLGTALGLCLFLGQAKPELIEVKAAKFTLVDDQGTPRGSFAAAGPFGTLARWPAREPRACRV